MHATWAQQLPIQDISMHEGQAASTPCQVSGQLASIIHAGTASYDLCIGLAGCLL